MVNRFSTISYDEVNLPSHKEAYADPAKTKIAQSYTGDIIATQESAGIITPSDMSRIVTESEIADLVSRKSENLQVVCESFDIDPATIRVSGNKMYMKQAQETYVVTMESALSNEIAYYWGNM